MWERQQKQAGAELKSRRARGDEREHRQLRAHPGSVGEMVLGGLFDEIAVGIGKSLGATWQNANGLNQPTSMKTSERWMRAGCLATGQACHTVDRLTGEAQATELHVGSAMVAPPFSRGHQPNIPSAPHERRPRASVVGPPAASRVPVYRGRAPARPLADRPGDEHRAQLQSAKAATPSRNVTPSAHNRHMPRVTQFVTSA